MPADLSRRTRLAAQLATNAITKYRPGQPFTCPVCDTSGHFAPQLAVTGHRRWALCPNCHALERHRLQAWVIKRHLAPHFHDTKARVIHFAPEPAIAKLLSTFASDYQSADFAMPGVDHHVDLRALPFADASFDLVYASHVLEHIDDDERAISEIRRILAPRGVAVLPVPLVGQTTVEYPEPAPLEEMHVRAPGWDYYQRYEPFFSLVETFTSADAPGEIQPYVFEDRSRWPTRQMPLRQPSPGLFHADAVPLCWV